MEVALGWTEPEDEAVVKNQAGSDTAGGADASESLHDMIKRASEGVLLGDGSDPQGAQANVRGARGKSPGKVRANVGKAVATKCPKCLVKNLTGLFKGLGMCSGCHKASQPKKKK